jgi:hypothetical protein
MRILVAVVMVLGVSRPALAFDTWWHAEETRHGAEESGFSSDARLVMQVENYLTDMIAGIHSEVAGKDGLVGQLDASRFSDEGYDYLHFDALWDTKQVTHNWEQLEKNTLEALKKYTSDKTMPEPFRKIAELTVLAASLHAVQDFYSHSNWVNYWTKTGKVPLWFEVDPAERNKLDIHTGAYPDGSSKGHANHGDLNKDNSTRPMNGAAVAAATRASTDWLKRLMADDPSLPWAEMQQYSIKGDRIMKDFLERLDATFLTTSSIALSHFDGPHPAKFIFAKGDEAKEKHQAEIMLGMTMKDYLVYVAADKNKQYKLPSPYWSSHFIYHVPRDIAVGLLCADKTYLKPMK